MTPLELKKILDNMKVNEDIDSIILAELYKIVDDAKNDSFTKEQNKTITELLKIEVQSNNMEIDHIEDLKRIIDDTLNTPE